jgi:hypothetical protein
MDSQVPPLSILAFVPFLVLCAIVGLVVWIVIGYVRERRRDRE